MFPRIKKSGKYQYVQIVENRREDGKTKQRVIATLGRLDRLQESGNIESLVKSLSQLSNRVILVLTSSSNPNANAVSIGSPLIFERLWKQLNMSAILNELLDKRKFTFDIERAVFLTVLHRLIASGSDRACDKWRRDYRINGTDDLELHHLYRAMAWLSEPLSDQTDAAPFASRCTKDRIEEELFHRKRDLFSERNIVFFDTTSLYFEGNGGETIGKKGHSKDHRPDLNQMIVGMTLDDNGRPLCCEMWPGNSVDVKSLLPVTDRMRRRFSAANCCFVADRGMISKDTMKQLEEREIPYILGVRMRLVNEVKHEALPQAVSFKPIYPEGKKAKDPDPLQVAEVVVNERRYIVCFNPRQARKDAADRLAIVEKLKTELPKGTKHLIGNKGYRKYLKTTRKAVTLDNNRIEAEAQFDGKYVLMTNTDWSAEQVALRYKELWRVEYAFRDIKSILETRPIYHQRNETIRGHVFCSFLALVLRHELDRHLEKSGYNFEWADIKQDINNLQEVTIIENDQTLVVRTECIGCCGKVFQSVGVAIPPTIREL
ncbi:MAG: IS1634 family transposase [Candidatus Hatepunaea meridiana]|nr:IS1634 family transposase [Candidatus Hatepunaea meridiana]